MTRTKYKIIFFTLKFHYETLIKKIMRASCPFRVTLSPSIENVASWRNKLALLGPMEDATCAKHAIIASQKSYTLHDVIRGSG
jgi:hypothetical protein